jgi:hypothetical protein
MNCIVQPVTVPVRVKRTPEYALALTQLLKASPNPT